MKNESGKPPMISIDKRLWNMLGDFVQDMGRVHPFYKGTAAGEDIKVLGEAIRYCISEDNNLQIRSEAEAIIMKHGYKLDSISFIGRCIETANRLLGLPT